MNDLIRILKTDDNGIVVSSIEITTPNPNKKIIKTVDLLGREISQPQKNIPYLEIYDDGTTEKKMKIK